ncbi:hypothetical protein AOQ84DRAFT_355670 [Glonium stellatum]|uniref:Uncharacterized protein n=1 Tax=Glonium stellatum TaxID=574774 RepID=A0A8E2JQU2_9PEZI|nr:hypothetical protein AOQ84DRAFT_355670 [Glonium stellatum]
MADRGESAQRARNKIQSPKTPTQQAKRDHIKGLDKSNNHTNRRPNSDDKFQSRFGQRNDESADKNLHRATIDQMDPFYTRPSPDNFKDEKGEMPFQGPNLSFSNRLPSSTKNPGSPLKDFNKIMQASMDAYGGSRSFNKRPYEHKSKFYLPEQLLKDSPYPLLKYGGRADMVIEGSGSAGFRPEPLAARNLDNQILHSDPHASSHHETMAFVQSSLDIAVKYGAAQNQLEVLSEKTAASEKELETYKTMFQSLIAERDEALSNMNTLWRRVNELEATIRSTSVPITPTHNHHGENGTSYSGHRISGFQHGVPQTPTFSRFAETPSTSLSVHKPPIRTETPVLKAVVHSSQSKTLATAPVKSPPTSDLRQQPYRGLLSDYFGSIEKWGQGYARLSLTRMGSLNPFARAVASVTGNWRGSEDIVDDLKLRCFVVAAIVNRKIGEATMAEDLFKTYDILKHQKNMELVDHWNKAVAQAQDPAVKRSIIADQVNLFEEMNQEEKYRYWRKDKSEELTNSLMDIFSSIIHENHRTKAFEELRELVVKGYRIAMRMRREHKKWDFNFPATGSQFQKDNMVVRNHYLLGDPQTTLKHVSGNPDNFKVLLGISPAIVQVDYSGNAVVTDLVHHSEVLIMRKH